MRYIAVIGIAAIASLPVLATPARAAAGIAASPPSSNAARPSVAWAAPASRTCSTQGRLATLHSASAKNVSTSAAQDWAATPRGERPHAVGAHVGEGHQSGVRRHRKRFPRRIVERLLPRHGNLNAHGAFIS